MNPNQKRGKRARINGADFERRVRQDLESEGWIVLKNPNTSVNGKYTQAKNKFNPFTKRLMSLGGFPDFICFRNWYESFCEGKVIIRTELIAVECKVRKYLDQKEKELCKKLLGEGIFEEIWIASKSKEKNKVVINYERYAN